MNNWRKFRAGLRITVVIALFWTLALVALRFGFFLFDGFLDWEVFFSWVSNAAMSLFGTGMLLGGIYTTGVGVFGASETRQVLSRWRSMTIGAIGGLAAYLSIGLCGRGLAEYGSSPSWSPRWSPVS